MTTIPPIGRPFRHFARDERGVAAIEYALLIALIAVSIVMALTGVGSGVARNFNNVDAAVGAAGTEFESP